ncbi:Kif28p [Symbiodinium sp. CCMP2592]|nr:Kif28p [Symbiodinium sp. CCMP2592]
MAPLWLLLSHSNVCLEGPTDSSFDMDVGFGSGLVPRTLEAIFHALSEEPDTVCVASFYEIHNERIRDLLAPATPKEAPAWQDGGSGGQPRNGRVHGKTTVHFHPRFGAFVAGVEEVPCDDVQEALRLVSFGLQVRTTAATMLNDRSSRSHAIFSLRMERSTSSNSIMLVDLAGREQERLSMCRTERFKELTLINRSLFHLAHCVRELAASQVGAGTANSAQQHGKDSAQWHHFRNSKLTMVLGHALAGNSHTAVVGTISPAQISFEDSLATLRFCESVKQVRTKPALPVSHREDVVMELQARAASRVLLLSASSSPFGNRFCDLIALAAVRNVGAFIFTAGFLGYLIQAAFGRYPRE